jgi:hypothetical protein
MAVAILANQNFGWCLSNAGRSHRADFTQSRDQIIAPLNGHRTHGLKRFTQFSLERSLVAFRSGTIVREQLVVEIADQHLRHPQMIALCYHLIKLPS